MISKNSIVFSLFVMILLSVNTNMVFGDSGSLNVKDFTVSYFIDNGEIIDVLVDTDFVELIMDFISTDNGYVEVTIPRDLLDAKFGDEDDFFYVLVDSYETEYTEINSDTDFRTISIPFLLGDEQIEIIGTNIIDETGLLSEINIPEWVRNNAGWWADGLIGDSDFVSGIQYLITNGIIIIPETQSVESVDESIPEWVRNNAGWWADGLIGDSDFVSGIQYLITNGIITIQ